MQDNRALITGFLALPLFYPVCWCTVLKKFISLQFIFGICQLLRSGLFHISKWQQSSSRITVTKSKQSNSNNQKLNLISFILLVHLDIIFWQWNIRQRKASKCTALSYTGLSRFLIEIYLFLSQTVLIFLAFLQKDSTTGSFLWRKKCSTW